MARGLLSTRVPKVVTGGLRAIRGDLSQAEFSAVDAAVRYYEGNATHAEYVAAREHLRLLRMATDFERRQAVRNLWRKRPKDPLPH
ncbi:MAG: hypothetical protein U0807_12780 [Candidatus Binatia bacterium]